MKKILLVTLFFNFLSTAFGASSDSVNFGSTIDPVCEVAFTPEPIASNLDLTASQTELKIGHFHHATNTFEYMNPTPSSPYKTSLIMDITDKLTHNVNPSYQFTLSQLTIDHQHAGVYTVPIPLMGVTDDDLGTAEMEVLISYTGVPALTLVQGVYSATWHATCSIDER